MNDCGLRSVLPGEPYTVALPLPLCPPPTVFACCKVVLLVPLRLLLRNLQPLRLSTRPTSSPELVIYNSTSEIFTARASSPALRRRWRYRGWASWAVEPSLRGFLNRRSSVSGCTAEECIICGNVIVHVQRRTNPHLYGAAEHFAGYFNFISSFSHGGSSNTVWQRAVDFRRVKAGCCAVVLCFSGAPASFCSVVLSCRFWKCQGSVSHWRAEAVIEASRSLVWYLQPGVFSCGRCLVLLRCY